MSLNKIIKKSKSFSTFSKLSSINTKILIQMNNVSASYDAKNYSLKEISLSIERGTNYSIVGQSGSGKSTLLKLINGMMIPSKGQIKVDYQTPNMNKKQFRRAMSKIGYIPQSLGLVKNISVLENVLIGALPRIGWLNSFLKKFPENEIEEAKKIIKLVGLKGKENRKAKRGEEKRREERREERTEEKRREEKRRGEKSREDKRRERRAERRGEEKRGDKDFRK